MPIYDYVCMSCESHFEELVGMSDPDPTCPDCGNAKVAKQFSLPARPQTEASPLPTECNSSGPPCGPACRRFGGGG